jgi:hypothetical protein
LPTHNHSEYQLGFYGPYVKCHEADGKTTTEIDEALAGAMTESPGTAKQVTNAYYAFVPYNASNGTMIPQAHPRYQFPAHDATNKLWITFLRYLVDPADGHRKTERQYMACELWNATYHLNLHWDKGFQDITASQQPELHNPVYFPNDKPGNESDMSQHAMSATAWAVFDELVGTLSWYKDDACDPINQENHCSKEFGIINTQLQHTSILGSSDLDVFFDLNEKLDDRGFRVKPLSEQRLQDKALAGNRTLDELIEELFFNTTVSLLHNPLLT